jgi:flagellar basal-body rod protein FlgG
MSDMMEIAVTGVKAAEQRLVSVSSNLANLQTIGYKRSQTVSNGSVVNNDGFASGVVTQSRTDFSRGTVVQTERALDIIVNTGAYFEVHVGSHREFTNVGRLTINDDGYLSDSNGFPLTDNIRVDVNDRVVIDKSGVVQVIRRGQSLTVGKITLYQLGPEGNIFTTEQGLLDVHNNRHVQRLDDQDVNFTVGYLEGSNVTFTEEVTELMAAQRHYQLNSKVISVADEVNRTDIELLRD